MRRLVALAALFVALIAIPLVMREPDAGGGTGGDRVIVLTASTEQIRQELGEAFARWHGERFGRPAHVIWSTPGGAVEIRRSLVSVWESRLRQGLPVGGDADVLLGGGSFEFESLRRPVRVMADGQERSATVLEPVPLPESMLRRATRAARSPANRSTTPTAGGTAWPSPPSASSGTSPASTGWACRRQRNGPIWPMRGSRDGSAW